MALEKRIEIVPYDVTWQSLYDEEVSRLQMELADEIVTSYHIGSTAIPNMPAKPVIDILLVCKNLDAIDAMAEKIYDLGYAMLSRHTTPHRSFFSKIITDDIMYHLHLREVGDPQIQRHINFIQYLSTHPDDAKAYANLKMQLAKQHEYERYKYTAGKEKLIQHICAKAKKSASWRKDFPSRITGTYQTPWSKEKILKGLEANINLHATHFAQFIDSIELIRVPGFTLVNANLADPEFNLVIDAHFASEQAITKIEEILHIIKNQPYPFTWLVAPYDQPANLRDHLEKLAISNPRDLKGYYFPLANVKNISEQSGLRFEKATSKKEFYDFALLDPVNIIANQIYFFQVADVIDEADPFEYYVGYQDDVPVVRGALVFEAQVVGIYHVNAISVNAEYQEQMLQFLLHRSRELGFHIAVILTPPELDAIITAMNFQFLGLFYQYIITAQ